MPAFIRGYYSDLAKAPPAAKRIIVWKIPRGRSLPWQVVLPTADQVDRDCRTVFEATGVWPLSYAYPRPGQPRGGAPAHLMSPLFPGHRYHYNDEAKYLDHYRSYAFAMTHKKAGWDCFRHVELMHAGGIPFMPDAPWIPPGTMVHYPKLFLVAAVDQLMKSGDIPPHEVFVALGHYFNKHLTTAPMARYIMDAVGMEDSSRVLFVDQAAVAKPDYTSNLTLIGLKQVLGTQVGVSHPTDYLYADWDGKARALYGRGFGYSRILDPAVKSTREVAGESLLLESATPSGWDWVVVGSVPRNPDLTKQVLDRFPAGRTILLHGEDTPPTPAEVEKLVETGAHVFVREISTQVYSGDVSDQ